MLHLGELLFSQCKPAGIRSAGIYFWTAVIFSFLVQPVSAQVTPGDPGNFITIWKTNIEQAPNSTSFRIPTHSGSTYNYDLYWESVDDPGENGMLTGLTGSVSVSVPIPGTYRVEISGTFPRMYSASFSTGNPYQHKLLSIEQWGDIKWESMEYAFTYAANLNIHAADAPDLSNVTTMHSMFDGAISLNSDLNHWDVSNVKNMRRLFRGGYVAGSEFNGDISSWDVSNVTQMEDMFQNATSFNGDLSSWDVSSVTQMARMFQYATSFSGDLSSWNVGNVEDMSAMFASAASFNGDISSWDVSGVRDMSGMFFNATSFNQDIGGWDVGMVEWMGNVGDSSIGGMFEDARSFDQDLGRWDVRNVRNMSQMLDRSGLSREHYDALLTGWSQLTLQQYGELDAAGLEYCAESARQHLIDTFDWYISGDRLAGDCSDPGTSPVVDVAKSSVTATSPHLADGVDASVVTIELVDRDGNPLSGLQEGDFEIFLVSTMDQDVQAVAGPVSEVQTSGIYTFSITDTIPESFEVFVMVGGVALDDKPEITFEPASQEPEFRPFITTWMTTDGEIIIPTMSRTGSYDYDVYWENLEDESDYGYLPGQSGSARLTGLRNGVPYRVEIRGDFPRIYFNNYPSYRDKILSIDQWGDIEWHSMEAAFYGCSNLEYNASDAPDLSRVTNMRMMFRNATSFNGDIQNWDVGNVTNMYGMFWSADMFNQDLSDWDVSRVVNMELMFNGAISFNGDINGWDVGNVTNMRQMFRAARSFNRELDKWDVRSVKDMRQMFSGATSFNQDLNSWDVSNVKDMDGMFSSSQAFNGNISDWDISGLTSLSSMFHYATSFNGDISGWDVSGITIMYGMFNTATSFNQDLSDWDMSAVERAGHMFYGASSFDQNLGGWNLTNLERMSFMFSESGMSTSNYDATLAGWVAFNQSGEGLQPDVQLGADGLTWCESEAERRHLIEKAGWTIMGDRRTTACAGSNFPEIDPVLSRVRATTPHLADSTDFSTVSITLVDTADLPVTSLQSYDFFIELTGSAERSEIRETSEAGTYSFTVIDPRPEKVQVTLTVGDVKLNDAPEIEFLAELKIPSSELSKVNASSPHLADGVDASVVTIELVDRDGNPLSGLQEGDFEIFLVSTMDQDVQAVAGPVSEVQTSGIYTFSITDTIPESFEVFVMVGGVALDDKPEITFEPASQEPEFRPFITTWMTTDGRITIPVAENGYQYSYDIYWESTVDSTEQGWLQHQTQAVTLDSLQMGTTYRVEIKGTFPRLDFTAFDAASPDSLKLLSVKQWGDVRWESMEYAFARATNLEIHAADAPDLRKVTSMKGMFAGAASVNSDFNHWDVSSVTNMESMFESASAFNGDISSWDVSGVLDMSGMFFDATSFNGDISSWDVSSVTQMARMFQYATSFSGDLSSWNVGNVEDMSAMFASAASFNGDISGWNVSNVRYMPGMFNYAETFNQDIGDWDVSNVEDMGPAFDAGGMFEGTSSFDQDLGRWDVRNVKNMRWMLDHSGLSRENYDVLLTGWSQLALQQSVRLDASGLEYCAEPARQHLIDMFDWEISGDRLAGDCSDPDTSPVVDASKSSVTATSPHLADGVDASVVTIELVDRDGNPLSGLQEGDFEINLVSNMDQDVRAVAGPVSEVQTSGIYTFSITSPAEGSLLVSVTIMGEELKDQPTVIFDAPVQQVDPALTKIIATGPHLADGMDRSVVTVQVVDEKRVPVSGLLEKDFRVVVTGSARTSTIRETNKGIYQFGVTNRVAETVELTVTIQGIRLLTEPKIQFEYPEQLVSSDLSDLLVTSPHLADGEDASTVTILLKDVEDKWISGLDPDVFTLDVSDGSLAGSLSETETGQYQFQVTSTIATSVRVTVTVKGVRLRAAPVILFEPVPKPVPDPPVIYSVTGNNNNITLTWNPVRESYVRGYQIYRGNEPHNMVLIGQAGPASDSFEDSQSSETALFYRISAVNTDGVEGPLSDYIVFYNSAIVAGHTTWKLVSTPLQNSVQNLEQTTLFGFSNQYELAAELQPSRGYWIKSKTISEETVPVTGTGLLSSTLMLRKGWNLIGSLSAPVSVNSISDPGRILTAAPVYGFSADGYQRTDKLLPNQGYWIYASESGEIEMRIQEEISEESNHLKAAKAIVAEDSPPDIWIDFSNDRQSEKLYIREFPGSEEESMRFMLPPEPPSPVLDVRTSGGLNLVQSGSERIRLQSETYPVRVTLHGVEKNSEYTWRFVLKDGIDEHVVDLIPGEPMMITQQYDRIEMVKIRMEEAITETRMLPGYPNPFNPAAIIQYQLKVSGDIKIEVYDSIGRRVQVLADGFQPSGQHQVSFHAGHLSTGVYIVRFVTGTGIQQQKITLIK